MVEINEVGRQLLIGGKERGGGAEVKTGGVWVPCGGSLLVWAAAVQRVNHEGQVRPRGHHGVTRLHHLKAHVVERPDDGYWWENKDKFLVTPLKLRWTGLTRLYELWFNWAVLSQDLFSSLLLTRANHWFHAESLPVYMDLFFILWKLNCFKTFICVQVDLNRKCKIHSWSFENIANWKRLKTLIWKCCHTQLNKGIAQTKADV